MLKNILLKNNYLKILSVIIAVFAWVIVVTRDVVVKNITVPLQLTNTRKNYVAVPTVSDFTVKIKGSYSLINRLTYSSIVLQEDVSRQPIGDSTIRIFPADVKAPLGITVEDVYPPSTHVLVDALQKKDVNVDPSFIGTTPKGYKVTSVNVTPNMVTVSGVRSKINNLSSIATIPINLTDLKQNTLADIDIMLGNGIKNASPKKVKVSINIVPDIATITYKNISVACDDLTSRMHARPINLNSIQVKGRADMVDEAVKSAKFYVDCSKITKRGIYIRPVKYDKSDFNDVKLLNISPKNVRVEVK